MSDLRIRRATRDDCRLYWEWANDPAVRQASFSSEPIPWEAHVEWFTRRLDAPDSRLYVISDAEGEPVAQVRFEIEGACAVVSVSVAASHQGKGYGAQALTMAARELFAETAVTRIDAYIKPDNTASLRLFEKAGYQRQADTTVKGQPAVHMALHGPAVTCDFRPPPLFLGLR